MTEQRKNQRFDLRLPCEIIRSGHKTNLVGETRNLSSAGVLLSSTGHVSVGEPIEYFITFPKPTGSRVDIRLRCVGKVLREEGTASSFAVTLERYEFLREPHPVSIA